MSSGCEVDSKSLETRPEDKILYRSLDDVDDVDDVLKKRSML